jgi:hypothetical protein
MGSNSARSAAVSAFLRRSIALAMDSGSLSPRPSHWLMLVTVAGGFRVAIMAGRLSGIQAGERHTAERQSRSGVCIGKGVGRQALGALRKSLLPVLDVPLYFLGSTQPLLSQPYCKRHDMSNPQDHESSMFIGAFCVSMSLSAPSWRRVLEKARPQAESPRSTRIAHW